MTTTLVHPAPTTAARRGAHAWRAVLRTEFRLFGRDPIATVWGFLLPVAAFVVLGCISGLDDPSPDLGGQTYLAVYQSVLPLLGAAMIALAALPPTIGAYRERGVLKRYAVTPMSPSRVLGAQLVIHFIAALCTGLVILLVGAIAFGTSPGAMTWGWLLTLVLTIPALLGLGLFVAAVTPTSKVAGAVGTVLFFPLMFGAGLWVPRASMPDLMRTICDWTPLGAANRAMSATLAGDAPPVFALLALVGYAVVLWLLAVRLFRWS